MTINKSYKTLQLNGKLVYYSDIGTGFPVVLVHGYLESRKIWDSFADALGQHFRVICPDLPGHGDSDVFDSVHSMDFLSDSILAILDDNGFEEVVMVGHSLGGYVTMAFLEHHPERLRGFCLFHSHPLADSGETITKRLKEIELIDRDRKDLIYNLNIPNAFAAKNLKRCASDVERAKRIAAATSDQGIKAMLHGMMERPDRRSILQETSIPFLWILGKLDNYIPYMEIQNQVTRPLNSQLLTLENSGHQGFIEEFNAAFTNILDFVRLV